MLASTMAACPIHNAERMQIDCSNHAQRLFLHSCRRCQIHGILLQLVIPVLAVASAAEQLALVG